MRARALVVDDSLTVRMDLRSTLSNAGFMVVACSTKTMAWTTLKGGGFSLAVLDIHLPDGNGIDLLKQIRSDPEVRTIQTILLSTEAEVHTRIEGLACGADRYIGKPYDRDVMARVARSLCRMAENSGPPTSQRSLSSKKILVISESPTLAHATAEPLRRDSNEIVLACSSEEALALLSIEPFACVLLDLPSSDALMTCRRLRQLPFGRDPVVVVVTASADSQVRSDLILAGGDELALKSTPPELVRVQVRRLLVSRRRETAPQPETPRP